MAISSATSIITFIRTDPDVAAAVNGIPSYLHSMTAFACMFLIKVAVKYGGDLIEKERVYEMITGLVQQFRSLYAGKWHLANLMAGGLEKMAATLNPNLDMVSLQQMQDNMANRNIMLNNGTLNLNNGVNHMPGTEQQFGDFETDAFFDYGMSFGLSPVFPFDATTFGMDGTAGASMQDFAADYKQMSSAHGT